MWTLKLGTKARGLKINMKKIKIIWRNWGSNLISDFITLSIFIIVSLQIFLYLNVHQMDPWYDQIVSNNQDTRISLISWTA